VEGSCEHGNEPSDSIKCWEVREWVHSWWLLKKGSAPSDWFVNMNYCAYKRKGDVSNRPKEMFLTSLEFPLKIIIATVYSGKSTE
jgi:hypothetical protein